MLHIGAREAVCMHQFAQSLYRRLCGDVAGVALQANLQGFPVLPKTPREQGRLGVAAKHFEVTEASFEHGFRPGEATLRQPRGADAGFAGAAHVQALDHRALLGAREGQQARRHGAGNAHGMRRRLGVKPVHHRSGHGRTVHTGQAWRMKAQFFAAVV